MHPRWAEGPALSGFLEPLYAAGLRALEFHLDAHAPDWPRFHPVIEDCHRIGFPLCFHAPHKRPYTIAGFSQGHAEEIKALYAPMLDVATRYAPGTVVLHGTKGPVGSSREAAVTDTLAFVDWALARYPDLTLALENLVPSPCRPRVGADRQELLDIVARFDDHRLGICWDMGHDVLMNRNGIPDATWLRQVIHTHVHDIDQTGTDHCPLLYGRVPYRRWLPALTQAGFRGVATLEVNGERLSRLSRERVRRILIDSLAEINQLLTVT